MTTFPRRIVVIAGYAPSLVNFRGPLLRALREQGHQVIALAPGQDSSVEAQLKQWGVHYQPIALERAGLDPRNDTATLRQLTTLLRDLRPDVVLAYTIKPVVYGLVAARWAGVKHSYALITGLGYSFLGGGLKRRALSRLTQTLYRVALSGATRVIFQNPDDQQLFLSLQLVNAERTVVVDGSGVDTDHYAQHPLPDEPVFLLIARLLKEKGIHEYVEAAQVVRARHPEARFLLAGPMDPNPSSVSPEALRQWIDQRKIEYLGELADVRPALAQCSVYVLPSYREGTPRTVLEAMSTGRAVITTDAPGCRETVQEGVNGLLVPVGNAKALAEAMERLVNHPQLRAAMGKEALKLARSRYDVRRVNGQMMRALDLTEDASSPKPSSVVRLTSEDLLKRLVDLVLSATILLLLSLPMLILSGLVRRFLGSPVLFSQTRPGLHGRPFTMYKFRTMTDARGPDGKLLPDSARMTQFGRFLRATSLDELPELFNVLKGEMSLVGPRPLLMEYLPLYSSEQARRHEVKPGVTGWAQVNGRNALSWTQKFAYDVWYVDHRSLKLDMHILLLTLCKVLAREGISAQGEATMPKFTSEHS